MRFDENPLGANAKTKIKRLKGFKFLTFTGRFQVTSWQWGVITQAFWGLILPWKGARNDLSARCAHEGKADTEE